jgi:hypothetical protein
VRPDACAVEIVAVTGGRHLRWLLALRVSLPQSAYLSSCRRLIGSAAVQTVRR